MHASLRSLKPSSLNRRRAGAIALAVIAIVALLRLRSTCESVLIIAVESCLHSMLILATGWAIARAARSPQARASNHADVAQATRVHRNPQTILLAGGILCVLFPLIANLIERRAGQGTGAEIAYMGALAWGGLYAAIFAKLNRTISISVVCSGFLTLFTTVSSDHHQAVYIAFTWGIVCLWWLVANHWERVESCQIDSVKSTQVRAPLAVLAGALVFVIAAWTASGRSVMFSRPSAELMPTSGGSGQYDAAARSGVGNGDAVVAARDHAASFGAVDTDVFLDSPQPSLFDMFNDQFGEPFRKKKSERAIALTPRDSQSTSSRTAQSNSSTQSFTTQRSQPKPRPPLKDIASKATMFWIGRPGERLATDRYAQFDGIDWHQAPLPSKPTFGEQRIGERVWFATDVNHGLSVGPYTESVAEAVKFTRYRSNRIPAPAGMNMWHIDLVDQADFFGFTDDHCLEMPNRDYVPDYTTVRFVNRLLEIEKLETLTSMSTGALQVTQLAASEPQNDRGIVLAKQLAHEWFPERDHQWKNVQLLVDRLRREFTFDRSAAVGSTNTEANAESAEESATPLEIFLTTRRGNDVMFATAAAVMLRELGFPTRFVTGFYVDPKNYDRFTSQTPITTHDAHAWLEIDVGMDTWVPLEPTPSFRQPTYRTTWVYFAKQHAGTLAASSFAILLSISTLWLSRAYLFEGLLRILSFFPNLLSDRRRVRCLVSVLDRRCQLAGIARPKSISPREWLVRNLSLEHASWSNSLIRFFNEADRLNYGNGTELSAAGRIACKELWRDASTFCLRRLRPSNSRHTNSHQISQHKNERNKTVNANA